MQDRTGGTGIEYLDGPGTSGGSSSQTSELPLRNRADRRLQQRQQKRNMKLGRNERCWCGSGKKYKRCHLDRYAQTPLATQEYLKFIKKTYSKGYCLHPQAGPQTCKGNIIKAHTIQRNGGLNRIAREGHVYNCLMHDSSLPRSPNIERDPDLVGIGQASTFTGFCSYHDDALFAPIEKEAFAGSSQQVALLGYRAISRELFLKKRDMDQTAIRREFDRGRPFLEQQVVQTVVSDYQIGVVKAIRDLEEIKQLHDGMLMSNDFTDMSYYIISFEDIPDLLCNATHQATHDFRGNRIQKLGHLDRSAHWLHFPLIATDAGGAAVFSWLRKHTICEEFINTLHELPDDELPHAIVRFTFEFFENTYFSPDWWDKLDKSVRVKLMERQIRDIPEAFKFPRPDDCPRDDEMRIVDWRVQSRLRHLDDETLHGPAQLDVSPLLVESPSG